MNEKIELEKLRKENVSLRNALAEATTDLHACIYNDAVRTWATPDGAKSFADTLIAKYIRIIQPNTG